MNDTVEIMDPDKEQYEKWQRDPNHRVRAVFYFNKDEPRFIVPKKLPLLGEGNEFWAPRHSEYF